MKSKKAAGNVNIASRFLVYWKANRLRLHKAEIGICKVADVWKNAC